MALKRYGVLVGTVVGRRAEGGMESPHFQLHVRGGGTEYRVAVNVLSQQAPSELLYLAVEDFKHPVLESLRAVPDGFSDVDSASGGAALDYIRGNLFDRSELRPMPSTVPGPDNDLADKLEHFTARALADPTARIYAIGERWGPESGVPDKIFGFSPGNGVHDIHMNQGNNGPFKKDDGVWQDGGLLFRFGDQWVAIFLAFQSQAWHTDDATGHALPGEPGPVPSPTDPHRTLRIVAALVNPVGPSPEPETVTLLNPGSALIDLDGWSLLDRLGQRMPLTALDLPAGEAVRIPLTAPIQLGNRGGTLTLLDPAGLKVDGISYTKEQAAEEGITLVF
ncbi:DUF2278 family protein [Streptomyces sp. SID13031]|uniref:DUF2278 family protein n=1 Tax=Streptomyces sp. SID13031 TaxID=2706046 RepID=UPI0013C893CE|nr:DUF2278 family protein [Streptomyces sp. SID13031]NEA37320.1 DUF2278 family protein [Streptomyces sp. SID13031]